MIFSVPNEDYVLPDAAVTRKDFLKAPSKKSRKPNSKFLIVTEVDANLCFYLFQNTGILNVFFWSRMKIMYFQTPSIYLKAS